MSDSEEDPPLDQRLKTITSEEATRNQTTNKKQHVTSTEPKATNPYLVSYQTQKRKNEPMNRSYSLRESLTYLKQQRQKYMQTERYSKIDIIDQQIQRAKSLIVKSEVNSIKHKQTQQKKLIKRAYKQQIFHFKRAWNEYFQQYRDKELHIMLSFKEQQRNQIDKAREGLKKKCQSLRSTSRELINLQKKEKYYKKIGDARELSILKMEKRQLVNKIQREKEQTINKWAQIEEQRLSREQSKKYGSLIRRIEQNRMDQEKTYAFERRRLKQKYKNVLSQLKHEHQMTFYYTIKWIDLK